MRHLALFAAGALLVLTACTNPSSDVALTSEAPTPASSEPTAAPSETPTVSPAPESEPPAPQPTEDATSAPAAGREVELWFLRDQGNYILEPELHALSAPTQAVARETMELLVSAKPRDPALVNVIPEGTKILDVSLRDKTLTVDVQFAERLSMGAGYEAALFAQIVHTGAQFATVKRVLILEEGRTPNTPHGVVLDEPSKPDERMISPVVIMEPAHGDTVDAGSVTVSGSADVYEATVLLRLINPDGDTVKKTFTTATCGTGCRGTWEHTFEDVTTPGQWTVVAGASDPSGGAEGSAPYKVRREFTVR